MYLIDFILNHYNRNKRKRIVSLVCKLGGMYMFKISEIINSSDYSLILISILKNTKVYSLIDEEYSKNKIIYDEKILEKEIFKNKDMEIVPESMINYAIKFTGIVLSSNGERFLDKVLQEGWPQLYSYIRNCNKVIYEDIAKIEGCEPKCFNKYVFYIVLVLCIIFDKRMFYETNEGKVFVNYFHRWRMSIVGESFDLNEFCKTMDDDCIKAIEHINQENILENRLIINKNRNMFFALFGLLESYDISINDEIGEYETLMKLVDDDKELLSVYAVSSKCLLEDILNSDSKKRELTDFIIVARFLQGLIKKYRSLYTKYMDLYENKLNTVNQLNRKITQYKNTNERLISENRQLKDELREIKAKQKQDKEQELIKINRQYESSVQKMAKTIEKHRDEIESLKMIIENLLDENHYASDVQITNDALNGTRGVIIGGSPQWQQYMRKILPHFKFIEAEQLNYDIKILENADKIYFNTAYNSHAMFYKTIKEVRKRKLEMVYVNSNSVTEGIRTIEENLFDCSRAS